MRSISPLKSAYIMSTKRLKTPPSLAQFPGILNKDGKAPPRAPAPRPSIYHFWQKRYAFRILVFKIWINHWQKRTFSRLLHSHKMYLVALLGSFTDRKWQWNTPHFHCGRQEEPAILMSRARFPRKMVNFHQRLSQILSKVFLSKDIQLPGGTLLNSWWGCAARSSKFWPHFRLKNVIEHPFSDLASKK